MSATEPPPFLLEQRVLLRAATSRDAMMSVAVLERASLVASPCTTLDELLHELPRGAGAIVLAEDVLVGDAPARLATALRRQPPWSDLPVLVLARQGADSPTISTAMDTVANVTVIERPVRVASFVSSVRTALRARKRQYDLRALLEGLHEADQRKTEFLATLAHELRNPLAPLTNVLTLLARKTPSPQEAERYYDMMRRQVDHMARLVNDLMEVSRITRGKIDLELAPLELQQVLDDAVELSRPLLDQARHTLSFQPPAAPLRVHGDAIRLTQVFSNLLNNAAKYTPPQGQIRIAAMRAGSDAVVEITDSGIGIAAEMTAPIFEMFVQASGASKAAQGGLGIGLTLVKTIVELHGGQVDARSAGLGQGSTFSVRLPIDTRARPAAPPDAATSLADPLATPPAAALVVDDNHDAADMLAELLRSLGVTTAVAYSGQAALDMLPRVRPTLAILDIGMPGMDGCALAERIRQDPVHGGIVLVALTGWGQTHDRQLTAAAGFDHHLVKPLDTAQLVAILRQARAAPLH